MVLPISVHHLLSRRAFGQDVAAEKFENVFMSMNFLLIQVLCGFDSELMLGMRWVTLRMIVMGHPGDPAGFLSYCYARLQWKLTIQRKLG